jgi:trans-2,3-dihydro-3-hydroxyanthranilate isomerase
MRATSIPFVTTDVFTADRFTGNQLAVFPDASTIDPALYQAIAREFNFSETVFVLPPRDRKHTRQVKIWTPRGELQFAGHPTVGTAIVLAQLGELELTGRETRIVLEEGVGPVPVIVRTLNGKSDFAQLTAAQLPEFRPGPAAADLARVLGLDRADVLSGDHAPEAVSCGTWFLYVTLRNRDALARARVRFDELERVLAGFVTDRIFLFSADPELPGSHYRARMYAPTSGIPEDPATGSAAVGLGGYLARRDQRAEGTFSWRIEQGFEMNRPSILDVEVDKREGTIAAVRVGGNAVVVTRGELLG